MLYNIHTHTHVLLNNFFLDVITFHEQPFMIFNSNGSLQVQSIRIDMVFFIFKKKLNIFLRAKFRKNPCYLSSSTFFFSYRYVYGPKHI